MGVDSLESPQPLVQAVTLVLVMLGPPVCCVIVIGIEFRAFRTSFNESTLRRIESRSI